MADFGSDSLIQAARVALASRNFTTARDVCQRILGQDRKNLHAIMLLADVARATQQAAEELELATRAVKLYPKNPGLRAHLGGVYRSRGDYGKALVQFEKALKLDPALLEAAVGKAEVFVFKGDAKKARTQLEPLVKANPTSPVAVPVYLRVLVDAGEHERAIEAGRRLVEAVREPRDARQAWFLLAQAYERTGDVEAAFAAARAGNDATGDAFVPEEYRRIVDACVETFTAARLAALPRAEPSTLPVFVVGVPRCGSTLTEQIIASHPQAYGAGESRAMVPIFQEMPLRLGSSLAYPQCVADLTPDAAQTLSRTYLDELARLAPRAERIVDKALDNAHHLGLINVLFPAARVIHCRRDPVDTCLSCYLNDFGPGQFPAATDLGHLGVYHREHDRLMRHWRTVLDLPVLEVEYETLVTDPEAATRRIIDFCDLPWDDACLRFHEQSGRVRTLSYAQVRQPVYRTSVKRADKFGPRLDPLRAALASN